jgi:cardiolipin synthase
VNAANLLTIARIVATPFVVVAILNGYQYRALVLLALAAFTDFLDGEVARRFSLSSPFGAYLDPIADKILLSGVFLALGAAHIAPWWLILLIFGRDLYILLGAAIFLSLTTVRKFPPSVWGKVSTFVQIVTALVCLVQNPVFPPLLWPCAAFTLWSGIHYTVRSILTLRTH